MSLMNETDDPTAGPEPTQPADAGPDADTRFAAEQWRALVGELIKVGADPLRGDTPGLTLAQVILALTDAVKTALPVADDTRPLALVDSPAGTVMVGHTEAGELSLTMRDGHVHAIPFQDLVILLLAWQKAGVLQPAPEGAPRGKPRPQPPQPKRPQPKRRKH